MSPEREFVRAEYVVINPVFHIHGFPGIGMAEGGLKRVNHEARCRECALKDGKSTGNVNR